MAIVRYVYDKNDYTKKPTLETYAVGCVLRTWIDHGIQIMSDVWVTGQKAEYWDEATQSPKTVIVWSEHQDKELHAEADATPEVIEKYRQYLIDIEFARLKRIATEKANEITKGQYVRVVKGRLAPKGTIGKVFVIMEKAYGRSYYGRNNGTAKKLGLSLSDDRIVVEKNGRKYNNYKDVAWAYAHNCELVQPGEINETELARQAVKTVNWQMAKINNLSNAA